MKKIITFFVLLCSLSFFAQQQTVTYSVNPNPFDETQSITLTFQGSSINEAGWGGATGMDLYLWSWSYDINDTNLVDCPTNGQWTNSAFVSATANKLTYNGGTNTYAITLTPTTFYNRTNIGRIGFLIKALNGTGDKKSQDIFVEVGTLQVNLTSPLANSNAVVTSGGSLNVTANNTGGNANYVLKTNLSPTPLNTQNNIASYTFNIPSITANQTFSLEVTQGAITVTKKFSVVVNPNTVATVIPAGSDIGINYNPTDLTKVILVLDAPGKDFIYVAGSFNNWQPDATYAMKKDPASTKFWIELTGLTSGTNYSYQYWVVDETPIANSPKLVKVADPCSTVVLSPFDDGGIPTASYPNIPVYPAGQEREVTLLKTGTPAYNWQVTNFVKPNKDKLIVYEVLIRDFDANRNYQDLINKIGYFKNLGINAIELMPIMEYEGNESWGYNTAFHMATDKYYGTEAKLKELVDLCHQNGIAVILDIAFNHAFGRNPMVRMYMNDADGDGWGGPATDNPFFNTTARHSYSVGEDFNHASTNTREYVKRTLKHWITEFKVDGFRWDLTKGFTQNCQGSDACTNSYQQDRVDVLKSYADTQWLLDNDQYVIFEHLGSDNEEQQWANYRLNEGKGIMMWGEMFSQYKTLAQGFTSNDISRMSHVSRGFTGKRLIGYSESHDKDRLMYEAIAFGDPNGTSPVRNNLYNAVSKMSAIGAMSVLIPGPKMIWHFQELGMDDSIWKCTNGTQNSDYDGNVPPGDCKLATKPQPQWTNNYLTTAPRSTVYADYSKFIKLKKNEPVFNGDFSISPNGSNTKQRLYIFDNAIPATSLKNVVILANMATSAQDITPDFPYTGTWVNLMDNSTINVTNTAAMLNIPAGGYRIYGNQPAAALSTANFEIENTLEIYPNPAENSFSVNTNASKIAVYNVTGQLVKSFENTTENQILNIDNLQKGIYLVKITNENYQTLSKKLIVK